MPSFPADLDLSFRPNGYFRPTGRKKRVLSSIKGANRQAIAAKLLAEGREAEIPAQLLQPSLPDEVRRYTGSIHPSWMGGEYLPDRQEDEVEIARITIASTTQDVTSVYAGQTNDGFRFRVVDEYEGETLTDRTERTAKQPLTLKELYDFFIGAWDLFGVLEMNFGDDYPRDEIFGFFHASSAFYPDLDRLIRFHVEEWLEERTPGS